MKKYYDLEPVNRLIPREPIPAEVRAPYLRPGEILSIQDAFPVAFQPVGTLEWHGRQNPIGCDTIKAEQQCIEAARRCGGVVMPGIYFAADAFRNCGKGVGLGMDPVAGFQLPGSFYPIEYGQLRDFMVNACRNYLNRGFKLVVIVSGHNATLQQEVMDEVCYLLKEDEGREPVVFTMEYTVIEKGNPRRHSDHAGDYETSMMLHHAPGRVNMKANDNLPEPELAIGTRRPVAEATAEEGKACFDLQVDGLAKFAREKLRAALGG